MAAAPMECRASRSPRTYRRGDGPLLPPRPMGCSSDRQALCVSWHAVSVRGQGPDVAFCLAPGPGGQGAAPRRWGAVLTCKHCVSAGTLVQCEGRALMKPCVSHQGQEDRAQRLAEARGRKRAALEQQRRARERAELAECSFAPAKPRKPPPVPKVASPRP